MSQSRGYLEDNPELESALDWIEQWYHIPVLAALLVFMLWNRVRNWENFVVDGQVLLSGNDPWYHLRSTKYVVQNWPATMPFDPWTYFPYGTSSGQFGTLFDQIVATAALIVGLGSPSQQTIAMVALFTPAVFGTVAAIPAYYIGKRLGGRIGGVTAVVVLALSAGGFLARSTVGTFDHQVAEALFQTLGVLGVMVALGVAEREKPVYEQFLERDVDALRSTVAWSVLAGFAISLYLWTWPPGVLLLGILGAFYLLRLTVEFLRGDSPEHTAISGALTLSTVVVFTLASLQTLAVTATDHSLLQPLLAAAVAGGCVFMAWLARYFEAESLDRKLYPVTVFGIIAVGAVLLAIVTPSFFNYIVDNVLRVVGFSTSPTAATVGEAQPLPGIGVLYERHGLAVFVAIAGALAILGEQVLDTDSRSEVLLVVVWGAFMLAATFTQARFSYYVVFPIAVLTGFVVGRVAQWMDFSGDIEAYQVLTVLTVFAVVVVPLVVVASPVAAGANAGPGGDIQGWDDSLQWMNSNTPEPGAYGTGDNSSMEYYGTYEQTDDFDYEEGAYGVMSWWDYGHFITTRAERIPNANPFQQGSDTAAKYLLAQNETAANNVLEENEEDDAKTRYVAIDWKMAETNTRRGGKFFAPPAFVEGEQRSDYYSNLFLNVGTQRPVQQVTFQRQAYYDTTVARLYHFQGSAAQPSPIVVDWENKQTQQGNQFRGAPTSEQEPEGQQQGRVVRQFQTMEQARQYVENDPTSQVGGYGPNPSERVPAMEHYRLVGSSEREAFPNSPAYDSSAWTKIFERVPGATIEGSGPENATVQAAVRMRNHRTNNTFVYRQRVQTDENGNFEMTVPYSTTGYDEYGPENGYTNVSVRADTQYQFRAIGTQNGTRVPFAATADVTDGQVVGENESATTVQLEPLIQPGQASVDSQDETQDGNQTSESLTRPSP